MTKGTSFLIVILILLVLGMGGYLFYDKVLNKAEAKDKKQHEENKNITNDNGIVGEQINPDTELAKILNKDCSYVAGTYKNGQGWTFTLKDNCDLDNFVTNYEPYNQKSFNFSKKSDGSYTWGVKESDEATEGSGLTLYPIGVEEPYFKTDSTKIRVLIGQGLPSSMEEVYFKQ